MAANEERRPLQRPWPWWRWVLMGLNTLALVLSAIMSWHYMLGGSMVGCSGASPCDQVLNSRWSMVADFLPVSGLATGVYLAMLFAGFYIGPTTELTVRRLSWKVILVLAGSVAGGAVWFTVVQKWIIGEFCFYCMTTHITGLMIAVLVFWRALKEPWYHQNDRLQRDEAGDVSSSMPGLIIRPLHATGFVLTGVVLAGIMAVGQVGLASSAVYSDDVSLANLPAIDHHAVPMAGSPDAPYVVTLLFDYQCSHCQKIHFMLDEAIRRFHGKLAFALCPAPLNTQCNPYIPRDVDEFKNSCELAKIGLAVWVAKREAFPLFENWMFTFESGESWRPRSLESASAKAIELVGRAEFDTAWDDPWIQQYIQTSTQIYGQTVQSGNGGVPKLIFGTRWVIPEPNNADNLVMILQKSLGVPGT